MLTTTELRDVIGSKVIGADDQKIGTVTDIYMDDETMEPEWLLVKTGWFGTRQSFVPTAAAQRQGDEVAVPYDKDAVKSAPTADAEGRLDPDEEAMLCRHYDMAPGFAPSGDGRGQATEEPDRAMTRSEEQMRVGTTSREIGRPRLRKWIETERASEAVPVSREEVRVVREPITEGNADLATDGPDLTENVHEEIVHEERPVVSKETVPKERVRLEKRTVSDEETVQADLRKEQIAYEDHTER